MTKTRALRIWVREGGQCYLCCKFARFEDAEIEHPTDLWFGGPDEDGALKVAHAVCHRVKTDTTATVRAKVKRIHAREDGTRRPRAKIKSPGFPEWKGTWAKRKFGKRKET